MGARGITIELYHLYGWCSEVSYVTCSAIEVDSLFFPASLTELRLPKNITGSNPESYVINAC